MRTYPIDHNWEQIVRNHLDTMDTQRRAAHKHFPGTPKFRESWDAYAGVCERFLDYIDTHFQSQAGFTDFLKEEARSMFPQGADGTDFLNQFNWRATQISPVTDAENLSSVYRSTYSEAIYMIAFEMHKDKAVLSMGNNRYAL